MARKTQSPRSTAAKKRARGRASGAAADARTRTEKKAGATRSRKSAPKAATGAVRRPAARKRKSGGGTVSIRMYRGLLGDFFFVQHVDGKTTFKMLIDCGVLQRIGPEDKKPATAQGKERIREGVLDLIAQTGGKLDLVVVTHEHYDHLSGYIIANEAFKDLEIGKLWLAWTEDRSDSVANSYRKKKNQALAALTALCQNAALRATPEMSAVEHLLQFYGDIGSGADDGLAAARPADGKLAGNLSCEAIIDWLKRRAGSANVAYLSPGEVHHWGVDDGLRAYVLGPPRDDARLRKLDPSGSGSQREVYLTSDDDIGAVMKLAELHNAPDDAARSADQPFSLPYRRPYDYGDGAKKNRDASLLNDPIVHRYEQVPQDQRIDGEWLGGAETLALKIDGDVNNTSLVLALELPGKEILLFAADAQVGNWLSWGDQTYPAHEGAPAPHAKIDDLLARTIFYKVGHHASHNATLRERGLELMTDSRLSAMIPVVAKVASEQSSVNAPKGWQMPYRELNARLQQRTGGRILRGDGDRTKEEAAFKGSAFKLRYGPDDKKKDPLWVELAYPL